MGNWDKDVHHVERVKDVREQMRDFIGVFLLVVSLHAVQYCSIASQKLLNDETS